MNRFLPYVVAGLLSLAVATPCLSAPAVKGAGDEPIQIKSDELLTDTKARTATFTGRVVARQGDMTIYADRMVVAYASGSDDLEKVEVFGNVRIVQKGRIGTGDHAVYDSITRRITLDGNPRVVQGKDSVTGKVITYSLDDESSVVTGGGDSRVEAVIHPKERPVAPRP